MGVSFNFSSFHFCLLDNAGSVALAEENRDFVLGFVCQSRISNDPSFVHFTPGM